jgi:hypothetical protein
MLKNICNYSAIILLSLVVLAGTAVAGKNPHKAEPVKVNGQNKFYNKIMTKESPQSYSVTVKEGQETAVKIHSKEGVSVRIHLPNGEIKEYSSEKYFNLEFHAAGEYVIELNSNIGAQYTLKVSAN